MPAVALVTGGNRGIGLGITRSLLAEGYAVAILATREEPAELMAELSELGEVSYTRGSVADLDDHRRYVDDALGRWGRIDLLVNNAGVAPSVRADLLEAEVESFDRVLDINLRGPYFLTQLVAKEMIARRGTGHDDGADAPDDGAGHDDGAGSSDDGGEASDGNADAGDGVLGTIINVSSISATFVSTNRGEYCISKAGVGMATRLWATRLAPEGIVVYEVRPGVIATDMTAGVQAKYDAMFADGLAPIPRWGRPADVAGAVVQLSAGRMPYSTGEVINVDGGMHIPQL